ncbi:MAG: hypothetical protein M3071_17425 [Actinomycetota bacterium]|nr:hypothetical protein [Actinomycetota bacterium]
MSVVMVDIFNPTGRGNRLERPERVEVRHDGGPFSAPMTIWSPPVSCDHTIAASP